MSLGLFPQEQNNALDAIQRMGPGGPPQPGFFSGIPSAVGTGLAEGETKLGEAFAGLGVEGLRQLQHKMSPDSNIQEIDPDALAARVRANSHDLLQHFTADPNTVGTAGQVLHGLASVGVRAVGGSPLGPAGVAAVAGGSEGYSTSEDLQLRGVDANTAHILGIANGLMTGAAVGTPLMSGFGATLTTRVLSGAAVNTAFGAADRATMHGVLAANGYDAMAAQYRVMDGQALASDAILGSIFGGLGHFHAAPSVVDAAHTTADAAHIESSADGVPVDPISRNNHVDNMVESVRALMNDEPVDNLKPVDTIPNPAQDALQEAAMAAHTEAAVEAVGEAGMGVEAANEPFAGGTTIKEALRDETAIAHENQGGEMADSAVPGRDGAGVAGANVERPGRGTKAEPASAAVLEREAVSAGLDPETRESVEQAQSILDRRPGLAVPDANGDAVAGNDALNQALSAITGAKQEGVLHQIAAACFGRG